MKIGDRVRHTKIRPEEVATVTKCEVKIVRDEKLGMNVTRTTYAAEFSDKSRMIFYGFDIGRFVHKVEEKDGQMHLNQFMTV